MINYTAKDPYSRPTNQSFFSSYSSLCSPFTNSYDKYTARVSKLVLYAQNHEPQCIEPAFSEHEYEVDTGVVRTHDGAVLDTFQITPRSIASIPIINRGYIVKFNGNNTLLETEYDKFARDARRTNSTVIGFDYRGVGRTSKLTPPKCLQDLVTDGIAQVQRLLDQEINSENITLDGMSLGGAVATLVAYHFHHKKQPVYLWVDRSFSSLSKVGAAMYAPAMHPYLDPVTLGLLRAPVWVLSKSSGWEEDIASAYLAIPSEYKAYMTVAKKSNKTGSKGDEIILPAGSLHKAVKYKEAKRTGHTMISAELDGHNVPRQWLISKKDPKKNGQQIYEEFIQRKSSRKR